MDVDRFLFYKQLPRGEIRHLFCCFCLLLNVCCCFASAVVRWLCRPFLGFWDLGHVLSNPLASGFGFRQHRV